MTNRGTGSSMDWTRVRAVFLDVCDLPHENREEALGQLCGDDTPLLDEVRALLSAAEHPSGPLARGDDDGADTLATDPRIGLRLGAYRITERIGAGGMGVVYRAARDDDAYEKTVAIKIVRSGVLDEDALRRFRLERRMLATLDHPMIARLLDGGVTPDGVPYFVMEHVAGVGITHHTRERDLPIRDRLRLFLDVCDAVAHAHRRLVVHRDLKPANILVDDEGRVKLLDFGIAKMLSDATEAGDSLAPATDRETLATPGYASPEQLRGERATTATDVYSLGVILHEMLTGSRPTPSRVGVDEKSPARLSGIARRHGDLDAIARFATHDDPTHRYAGAAELAEDVRRFLRSEPVRARPTSATYVLARFVSRHRGASAFLVLALAATITACVATWRDAIAIRQARARAESIAGFLDRVLTSSDPGATDHALTMREVLDRAAAWIDGEFASDPDVRASLHGTTGRAYAGLGEYEAAARHVREALEIHERRDGPHDARSIGTANDLVTILYELRRIEEAEALLETTLERARAAFGEHHELTALTLNNLGVVLGATGRQDEAEAAGRRALAIRRALTGDVHPDIAQSLNNLARFSRLRGDHQAAIEQLAEALAIRRRTLGAEHPLVAQSLANLAVAYFEAGDMQHAIANLRESVVVSREALGDDHPDLAHVLTNLAGLLARSEPSWPEAESLLREALDITRSRFEPGSPRRREAVESLARFLELAGRAHEARALRKSEPSSTHEQ